MYVCVDRVSVGISKIYEGSVPMSLALIQKLNAMLLSEMPEYRRQAAQVAADAAAQRSLLRALMNVR